MCTGLIGRYTKSLFGYLSQRPPVTIFIFFLAGLAIGCLILASYIQQNRDVIDYESTNEYKLMIAKLEKIQFCSTKNTKQYNKTEREDILNQHGKTTFVNISLPVQLTISVTGNSTQWSPVSELTSIIPYYFILQTDDHVHNVGAHIFLKEALNPGKLNHQGKTMDGCLRMIVKRDAVPSELPRDLCGRYQGGQRNMSVHMSANKPSGSTLMKAASVDGIFVSLKTKPSFHPVVYLNILDRGIVSARLSTSSYVLFIIFIACVLYAIMRGNSILEYKKVTTKSDYE